MPSAFLHPFAPPARETYITIAGGEGAVVWDDTGNRYIDGMASLWYMNVGHGRREMVDAISAQAATLASYNTFAPWSNRPAEELAATIADLVPIPDARVFFGCSGSEAVDSAMKLARLTQRLAGHSERTLIVSRVHGYHGTNFGGTSAQGIDVNREGWGPLVGDVVQVPSDSIEPLSTLFAEKGEHIAAVLTEPVQGAGGVYPPPPGYLEAVRRLCDEHGALMIMDEVITGFGRLGTWFGSQYYGVIPDLMTFAKAVTSGYVPLSGVVVGSTVRSAIEADPDFILRHGYTYSGHPLACAAGNEALAIQKREGLVDRAGEIGSRIEPALRSMEADGIAVDVRGVGGVWGVGLPEGGDANTARNALLERGVIMRPLGAGLAICPPLVISDDQIDHMMDALAAVLAG